MKLYKSDEIEFLLISLKMLQVLFAITAISIVCCEKNSPIGIAYYDEIKDIPNHCEKLLVDVREPSELERTGRIPLSINVPCKTCSICNLLFREKNPFFFCSGNCGKNFFKRNIERRIYETL